jgi:hypothetical protein
MRWNPIGDRLPTAHAPLPAAAAVPRAEARLWPVVPGADEPAHRTPHRRGLAQNH